MTRQIRTLLLFFLLFASTSVLAQTGFPFDESGYSSVMQSAQKQKKPVLYMIYASWCPHCHKMREEVFPDKAVSAEVKQHFVVASQDVELEGGRALAKKYNVGSYPTFLVLDADGNLLYGFGGELKKEDFLKEVSDARQTENQLPYLKKAFENAPADGNRALAYIMALRKATQSYEKVASDYLKTQSDEQLASALNWKIIANGVSDINSREFRYVIANRQKFEAVASAKRVDRKIDNIIQEALRGPAERGDTLAYNKQRILVAGLKTRRADSLAYIYDKQVYERVKDWEAYKNATFIATDEFASTNYAQLRMTAAVYLAEINDVESLKKAVSWSEKANQLQASKEGYLQIAKLYEKLKDFKKARAAATEAREFASRLGFGTKEADEILNRLQSK